jgi:hypothetical protein
MTLELCIADLPDHESAQIYKLKVLSLQLATQVCSGGDAVYDVVPVAREIYNARN